MAKKQKRSVSSNRSATKRPAANRPAPNRPAAPVSAPVERPATPSAASRASSSYNQEFQPDYHLVVQDLKRIGIMAVSFITILIALSFFLK